MIRSIVASASVLLSLSIGVTYAETFRIQGGIFTTHLDNGPDTNNDSELWGLQYSRWFYAHFINSQGNPTQAIGYDITGPVDPLPEGWEAGFYLGATYGYCGIGSTQEYGCRPNWQPFEAFHIGYSKGISDTPLGVGASATIGGALNTSVFLEYRFGEAWDGR